MARVPRKPTAQERNRKTLERIRKKEIENVPTGTGGGFAPISAAVYDGYSSGDPAGEQGDVTYKISDAGVSGDTGQISQESGSQIPPNYANNWLRYVWYDDGFSASTGFFVVPQDGVYAVHGRLEFSILNGHVDDCNLRIRSISGVNIDIAFGEGARNVAAGSADVLIDLHGQTFLVTGTQVRMGLTINMSGLTGLSSGTNLITIPRASRTNPPPTDSASPNHDARFSITKISDTTP